jgi:hypothetical protein
VSSRILRQDFAGGFVQYDDFTESTTLGGVYCWDRSINC